MTARNQPARAARAAPSRTAGLAAPLIACLAALLPALPAAAQYKVVNADGSITYTDRPPVAAANVRITQMGPGGAAPASNVEAALPPELQQVVRRYPVALYTTNECATCERAREYLQRRGIPYRERQALNADDVQALERLVGSRAVPSLTVGPQPLVGYDVNQWAEYLDAAGYPRESKLPRGWQPPAPTPLTERPPAPPAAPPAAAPGEPPPTAAISSPPDEAAPAGGRLRF
jgi:glutaredoxin